MSADDDKVSPIREPGVIAEVGGLPDESSVSLCIYGEELRPAEVTAVLGVEPTSSFVRGFKKGPRSLPMKHGAWFYRVEGHDPQGPDDLARALLLRFALPPETWAQLCASYSVQIRVAMHFASWNNGFSIAPTTARLIAATGASVEFDLYGYAVEEGKS